MNTTIVDVAIVGGGLAGLSLAIQCRDAGFSVALFEKESYPFHKVCGEYISMESKDFLQRLGLPLNSMDLPTIKRLHVSDVKGNIASAILPLGGFGISRYTIDNLLYQLAKDKGVEVFTNTKVQDVQFDNDLFSVSYAQKETLQAKVVAGTFGKRCNIDIKWKRKFTWEKLGKLNNYVGIKYHLEYDYPNDLISLHNFKDGYCGISRIEDNKCCMCYLTTAENLKKHQNSIPAMEKHILSQNPQLKAIFTNGKFLFKEPVVISQVSFTKKTQVENHVLLIGDAAGVIAPICGNGMSMALHGSKLAFVAITAFLNKEVSREAMEWNYTNNWKRLFSRRMAIGRYLQSISGKERQSVWFVGIMKMFPFLATKLVKGTHGEVF